MDSAAYHRAEAELCLEIGRLMSDAQAADRLKTQAAQHLEQAAEIEKRRSDVE